jgi:ABC-type uncharacterized transport system ATPase subunit
VDTVLAVDIRGLVKRFGERTAVDAVDLRVKAGTVHGLLGPNAAGETTLLAMLFGLVPPTPGRSRCWAGHGTRRGRGSSMASPPAINGKQTMVAFDGTSFLNPLWRFDGCFNNT